MQLTTSATEHLILTVLQEIIRCGVQEVSVCPGGRNTPLVQALIKIDQIRKYYWFEERSAAFFALGRSRETQRPVAVITTSGTAAGELLPAAMEAYYSGTPLILITADRPASYRGTGAPQAAEQVNLFGVYASPFFDVSAENNFFTLQDWPQLGPAHINVCIEEPLNLPFQNIELDFEQRFFPITPNTGELNHFFNTIKNPFVVVSTLQENDRLPVLNFLKQLNAPVYLEAISGLRGHPDLRHTEICCPDRIWQCAREANYPIDGVLRLGGVPTFRSWRDLEKMEGEIRVLSVNRVLFSGLSWGSVIRTTLPVPPRYSTPKEWLSHDKSWQRKMEQQFIEQPQREVSMFYHLSKIIPENALVYLGNSLPIREWDLAADRSRVDLEVRASRGVNGIDGQISTFLGMCGEDRANWGIFGDLTTLYDLAGPWILKELAGVDITIVVVNNGGGRIFEKMFPQREIMNEHSVKFKPLADLWGMSYERWTSIPFKITASKTPRLIEIVPG